MTEQSAVPFYITSKNMEILLLITNHCNACARAREQLKDIQSNNPEINADIRHINSFEDKRIFITPAWIVNGELFAYGDIDRDKLISK